MLPERDFPNESWPIQDSDCWPQLLIEWTSWAAAERTATERLLPVLTAAEGEHRLDRWFFVRKHPHWRLRYLGDTSIHTELVEHLQELHNSGDVSSWTHSLYEPETLAFGGPDGIRTAHELFHRDSHHALAYVCRQNASSPPRELGRRELAVVLISTLLRAAGLDWYEQGDVWHRLQRQRTAAPATPPHHADRLRTRLQRLMTVDALRADGSMETLHDWLKAFATAGHDLSAHALHGRLQRGLRAILAHHALFAFNRLGLPAGEQNTLSELATDVIMNDTEDEST